MALTEERLRSIVESLLLISPEPIPVARLVEVVRIEDATTEEDGVRAAIAHLLQTYQVPDRPVGRGFRVEEVAGGLQLRTVAENAPFVRRFLAAKPQRLSKAALETLAIVAYRQPVTKPEIESIRGVDAGAALKSLLERDFVKIIGKRDEVGRPLLYGTTPSFLEFFTLRSLSELPTLREFHELDEASMDEVAALDGAPDSVRELAEAAQFLVERENDPDLDALDAAVRAADAAKAAAEAALDGTSVRAPEHGETADPSARADPGAPDANTAPDRDAAQDAAPDHDAAPDRDAAPDVSAALDESRVFEQGAVPNAEGASERDAVPDQEVAPDQGPASDEAPSLEQGAEAADGPEAAPRDGSGSEDPGVQEALSERPQ